MHVSFALTGLSFLVGIVLPYFRSFGTQQKPHWGKSMVIISNLQK